MVFLPHLWHDGESSPTEHQPDDQTHLTKGRFVINLTKDKLKNDNNKQLFRRWSN